MNDNKQNPYSTQKQDVEHQHNLRSIQDRQIAEVIEICVRNPASPVEQILELAGLITSEQRVFLQHHFKAGPEERDEKAAYLTVYRALLLLSERDGSDREPLSDEERRVEATLIAGDSNTDKTEQSDDPSFDAGEGNSILGRFRWLRPHAQGGLGKVSIAFDTELSREVAFKQIKREYADSLPCRLRFLREAQITASLEHPGIVPVYGMSTDANGRPYYAMRFIQGESLKEAIARYHELPLGTGKQRTELRRLLRHFVYVCNTVQYAHSRRVIHRDLKPGNVMLGPYGETLVVDWGLGKILESAEGDVTDPGTESSTGEKTTVLAGPATPHFEDLTQQGQVVGTPGYMSPEQMCGNTALLGPSSDIYSLGAILYCLLSGQSPFSGSENQDRVTRVLKGDFPAPRALRPEIPPALEAICLRAMALNPHNRYGSAADLATDIEAWMADEPVNAHRETASERIVRVARRYRSWTMAAVLSLILLSVGSIIAAVMINHARYLANEQADIANSLRLARESEATRAATPVRSALLALSSMRTTESGSKSILPQSRAAMYNSLMSLDGRPFFSLETFPRRILAARDGSILTVNGNFQLEKWMPHLEKAERLWALPDEENDESALDPTGRMFAVGTEDGTVTLWDVLSNPPQKRSVKAHAMFIDYLGFDEMSRWLVTCSGDQAIIWNVANGQFEKHAEVTLLYPHARSGFAVAAGNHLMVIRSTSGTEFFDLTQDPPTRLDYPDDSGPTGVLQTDAAGRWMVTTAPSGALRVWDLAKNPVDYREVTLNGTDSEAMVARFSDDGKMLVVGFRGGSLQLIRPFESDLQTASTTLTQHADRINDIAFDQTGKQLVTVCRDGSSRLWDMSTIGYYPFREVHGHDGMVHSCEFDATGSLLTGGDDLVVRTFHRTADLTNTAYRKAYYGNYPWDVQFGSSGKLLVSGSEEYVQIRGLIDSPSGDQVRQIHVGPRRGTAISNDERWLVTCDDGHFRSFDLTSETPETVVHEWDGIEGGFSVSLSFSPNDDHIVAGSQSTLIWKFKDGRVIGEPQRLDLFAFAVRFSPDGQWLAVSPPSSTVLFRFENGVATQVLEFPEDVSMVNGIDFSPDGRIFAWAGADGKIRLWSLSQDGPPAPLRELPGHIRRVAGLRFSPDGNWLASCGTTDGTIRLWDINREDATTTSVVLRNNWGQILSVDFDPQTQWLAASIEDGFVHCWNLDPEVVALELNKRAGRDLSADEKSEYLLIQ